MNVAGYSMTKNAADRTFAAAGFSPGKGRDQVGVVELHDCFSSNEVRGNVIASMNSVLMLWFVVDYLRGHWIVRGRRSSEASGAR